MPQTNYYSNHGGAPLIRLPPASRKMAAPIIVASLWLGVPGPLRTLPVSPETDPDANLDPFLELSSAELHRAWSHDSDDETQPDGCLLYTSPSPRDRQKSRMPSSA